MAQEILTVCKEVEQSEARVVLFTSTDPKAFCSGADLKERNQLNEEEWKKQHLLFSRNVSYDPRNEATDHCPCSWVCFSRWF